MHFTPPGAGASLKWKSRGSQAPFEAEVEIVEPLLPVTRRQVAFVLGEDVQEERGREVRVTALGAGVEQPVAVAADVEIGANHRLGAFRPRR